MTRSGFVARISSVLAVQLSWRMWGFCAASSGRASRQYFVQAQSASSVFRAARVMVIEGWREAIRIGFEYCILCGRWTPPLSKVCKVFEGDTLGLDFGFGELCGWRAFCDGCLSSGASCPGG